MFKRLTKFDSESIILLAVVALGLGLRLYGIRWGLPDAAHPGYSYHPDETLNLVWARWLVEGNIIPKQFIYGGTFYYTIVNVFSSISNAKRIKSNLNLEDITNLQTAFYSAVIFILL